MNARPVAASRSVGSHVLLGALALAAALVLPPAALAGKGHGSGGHGKPDTPGSQSQRGKAAEAAVESAASTAGLPAFTKEEHEVVRRWFADEQNLEGLPPGLAKRESLPPGLRRQVEKNGELPPGLQEKLQPLPEPLESQLPKLPEGVHRGVLGTDLVLVDDAKHRILDVVRDALAR